MRTLLPVFLVLLLAGCGSPPGPTQPGVSARLRYPVLLAGPHRLVVRDDEPSLTSTTGATGLNFPEFTLVDAGGARYAVRRVTEFGRKSAVLDLGTSRFRVFLELQPEGRLTLAEAKALVRATAVTGAGLEDAAAAEQAIAGAGSMEALIEVARGAALWR